MSKRLTLLGAVFVLFLAGLVPLLAMVGKSLWAEGNIGLRAYGKLLHTRREWVLILHSLTLSTATPFLTTLVGVPLGILFGKTDLIFRRGFTLLFSLPLLIPPYITAVAWFLLLGRDGVVSHLFGYGVGETASVWLFSGVGCVGVLFTSFLPISLLLTLVFLKTVDPRLEEAARLSAGWPRVLRKITLPLILPGILLAATLVFLLALGEFGVPSYLRYPVFPVECLTQFSAFYNFGGATAAAMPLLILTGIVLVCERVFIREKTISLRPHPGKTVREVIKLGMLRGWMTGAVAVLCGLMVVLPFAVLIGSSLSGPAFMEALRKAGDSIRRSVTYAAAGATALTILGFLLGYLVHDRSFRFWRVVDSTAFFLFAISGTVLGIGLIALWNRPITSVIYGSSIVILIGYVGRYTVIPLRMTVATLATVPPSMEEAAQVSGASWIRRFVFIVAPLAKRGLMGAWLVGYIFCLRDTGISMVVYPPGHETLPIRIFTLMANGSMKLIAALCVIMVLLAVLPLGIGGLLLKGRRESHRGKGIRA